MPKGLIAIRPLVHRVADTLRRAGADEVIVVAEADTAVTARSLLGAGARSISFIEVIGAHARVTDSYVGPYASIGDGAVIENAKIASSIVLPRARIRHAGVRVEDCITLG